MSRRVTSLLLLALVAAVGPAPAASSEPDPVGVWPLRPAPEVVRGFEAPSGPYAPGHRGVDLAGSPGQGVRSALPGTVRYAGRIAGRGVVVVGHGATRTTYEPVAASVSVGDQIRTGGPIGALETFGSHCAPRACLHWGWLRGETYLDPLGLVGPRPVRLLPLAGTPATTPRWPAPPAGRKQGDAAVYVALRAVLAMVSLSALP